MDISNSFDGLRSMLGINNSAAASAGAKSSTASGSSSLGSDSATLSSAASEVSQTASADGVRMDKVSSIQAMLAAGTYNVPASAVASRVVDAMLSSS
jgi:flagellar biosynthesis anti-sigma factor FlgM